MVATDRSIKTLAKFLGFQWRDTNPSETASTKWFDLWITTANPAIKQRILDYEEGDNRVAGVLADGISKLAKRA